MFPYFTYLVEDLKVYGDDPRYVPVLLLDFFDVSIYTVGVFFMGVYMIGKRNRLAVYAFAVTIPVEYIFFYLTYENMYQSSYTVTLIFPVMSYIGLYMWRRRVKFFRALVSAIGLFLRLAVFIKYLVPLCDPNKTKKQSMYLKARSKAAVERIGYGETNFTLIMHRFLVLCVVVDLAYVLLSYGMCFYYGIAFEEFISDYATENGLFSPSVFHSIAAVFVTSYFFAAFMMQTIIDQTRPDTVGINETATFDHSAAVGVTPEGKVSVQVFQAGIKISLVLSILAIQLDMVSAAATGLVLMASCYFAILFFDE